VVGPARRPAAYRAVAPWGAVLDSTCHQVGPDIRREGISLVRRSARRRLLWSLLPSASAFGADDAGWNAFSRRVSWVWCLTASGSLIGGPVGLGSVEGMSWAARQMARSLMSWPSTCGGSV